MPLGLREDLVCNRVHGRQKNHTLVLTDCTASHVFTIAPRSPRTSAVRGEAQNAFGGRSGLHGCFLSVVLRLYRRYATGSWRRIVKTATQPEFETGTWPPRISDSNRRYGD
jgi:hypothetical protein